MLPFNSLLFGGLKSHSTYAFSIPGPRRACKAVGSAPDVSSVVSVYLSIGLRQRGNAIKQRLSCISASK